MAKRLFGRRCVPYVVAVVQHETAWKELFAFEDVPTLSNDLVLHGGSNLALRLSNFTLLHQNFAQKEDSAALSQVRAEENETLMVHSRGSALHGALW